MPACATVMSGWFASATFAASAAVRGRFGTAVCPVGGGGSSTRGGNGVCVIRGATGGVCCARQEGRCKVQSAKCKVQSAVRQRAPQMPSNVCSLCILHFAHCTLHFSTLFLRIGR